MIRILYYKYPSTFGENVLVTNDHIYPDSEIAVLVDTDDLRYPWWDIIFDTSDPDNKPEAFPVDVPRDELEPHVVIDENKLTARLPFSDGSNARYFAWEVMKRHQLMLGEFDA